MADCSKTVEFFAESERLCEAETDKGGGCGEDCPFFKNKDCIYFSPSVDQDRISIVQKWSDEHPVPKPKTYADDFFEKFPAASRVNERPAFCRGNIYRTPCRVAVNGMNILDECNLCWNEVMPE